MIIHTRKQIVDSLEYHSKCDCKIDDIKFKICDWCGKPTEIRDNTNEKFIPLVDLQKWLESKLIIDEMGNPIVWTSMKEFNNELCNSSEQSKSRDATTCHCKVSVSGEHNTGEGKTMIEVTSLESNMSSSVQNPKHEIVCGIIKCTKCNEIIPNDKSQCGGCGYPIDWEAREEKKCTCPKGEFDSVKQGRSQDGNYFCGRCGGAL